MEFNWLTKFKLADEFINIINCHWHICNNNNNNSKKEFCCFRIQLQRNEQEERSNNNNNNNDNWYNIYYYYSLESIELYKWNVWMTYNESIIII